MDEDREHSASLLPARPLHRWVFIVCMALVAVSTVAQLIWAAQRHF